MKKSIAVIGIGRFGSSLVKTLATLKADILVIDTNEEPLKSISQFADREAIADSTKIDALRDLDISHYDCVVVAIGNNIHATIITTINLVELKVPEIIVRVDNADYVPVMNKLGASKVIVPEESSAVSFAHQIVSVNFADYYDIQGDFGIVKIQIRRGYKPKSLIELDSRNKYGVNVVGIIHNGKFFIPKGTDIVEEGDELMVIGAHENLNHFSLSLEK